MTFNDADYQKLKEAIQKANPEIMELKFGCVVWSNWRGSRVRHIVIYKSREDIYIVEGRFGGIPGNGTTKKVPARHVEILGRPIRLADIVSAIHKKVRTYPLSSEDSIAVDDLVNEYWNLLDDNLDNQSYECKQFLIDLILGNT